MGTIVDQNSNPSAVDTWALVSGTAVSNIISANLYFIESIQASYDYLVDITVGQQDPVNTGYIYDSGTDSFSAPPVDYGVILRADINNLQSSYSQALSDYNAAVAASQQSNADTGVSNGIADASASYSSNEATPFAALVALLATGG